jgi:hypothetical protein
MLLSRLRCVRPKMVVEVRYAEWTLDRLRRVHRSPPHAEEPESR